MAKQEQVDLLMQGVPVWNAWRFKHLHVHPDLRGANLSLTKLSDADLSDANLSSANLIGAYLIMADLSLTKLSDANLRKANLRKANLRKADLIGADLSLTKLSEANLSSANLSEANLSSAGLRNANLSGADLYDANLSNSDLSNADLSSANFSYTIFAWVDLSSVKGLETAIHRGPSTVNINSVTFPTDEHTCKHFLLGVGFTETQIEYLPSLLTPRSIQYHSLFISYASQDEIIAKQLHRNLQKHDVPCWFAPHDLKPGDYFREEIDKAIHMQEKLLLILSAHSVASKWVKYEVNRALNREVEQDRKILFPIRLDDAVLNSTSGWAADLRAYRYIGDFSDWQDNARYQQAFTTLLGYLKVAKPPTG